MTTEYISGCIHHKDVRHIRIYYDYMDIYNYNEEKAKIVRIIETWTDSKRAQWYKENYDRLEQGEAIQEPDFWITMSHQQFREFMRFSSNAETIKRYLSELEKANHIKRRINPDNPYGAPQYLLNCKAIQKAIDKLATPPYIPAISTQDTPQENIDPPHKYTPPPGVQTTPRGGDKPTPPLGGKLPPPWGGNTPPSNITTKNDSNDNIIEERDGANAPTPAQLKEVVDEKIEEVKTASGKHKAVSSHSQGLQESDEPHEYTYAKLAVRTLQLDKEIDEMERQEAERNIVDSTIEDTIKMPAIQHTTSEPVPSQDGAASAAIPPAGSGPRRRGKSPAPERPPSKQPTAMSDSREIQARIDAWRGYALEEKVEIIRERQAIKTWCSLHTIEEYEQVMLYLTTQDKYWKLEENKYRIGGLTLAKETPKALSTLGRNGKKPTPEQDQEYGISGLPRLKPLGSVK